MVGGVTVCESNVSYTFFFIYIKGLELKKGAMPIKDFNSRFIPCYVGSRNEMNRDRNGILLLFCSCFVMDPILMGVATESLNGMRICFHSFLTKKKNC